jgi:hypothetical protein
MLSIICYTEEHREGPELHREKITVKYQEGLKCKKVLKKPYFISKP